jgi:signal transduction histidine kinase
MLASQLASNSKGEDYEKELYRLRRIIAFRDRLSELLSHTQDFSTVVDEVFAELILYSGSDGGILRLVSVQANILEVYQSAGLPQEVVNGMKSRRFGEGVAGYGAQSGEVLCVETANNKSDDLAVFSKIGITSVLALPLAAKERVIGVLELFIKGKRRFPDEVIQALMPASRQIGIAFENMQLMKILENRINQRNRLYLLMRKLQTSTGLDELLAEIVDILTDIYSPAYAIILLYDPTDQMLRIKAASAQFMDKGLRKAIPLNQGVTGYAAMNRTTVLVRDTLKDSRYIPGLGEIRSELAAPLIAEGKLIGVLDLESPKPDAFSNQDRQLLTIYAQQAAMAIANLQLFEKSFEQNLAKSRMISALSHEFRTPLAVMKSYAWYLKNNPQATTDQIMEHLDIILGEVENLNDLIESLLNLGRLEQGRIDWQIVRFELKPVLVSLVESMSKMAEDRGIEIVLEGSDLALVWGDVGKLRQSFMNLLSNAIKYNRDGGRVGIKIEDISDDFVRVKVADNGIGIASEHLDKIFNPFYRVPGSSVEGVGLGLALTRQFIEDQGGWIEVESVPAKGTTFFVYLSKRGGA